MTEPDSEKLSRLRSMAAGDATWDLSPNDQAAIQFALDEIERLTAGLKKANEQAERFEREWYLRGDEIECLQSANESLQERLHEATKAGTPYAADRDAMNALVVENQRLQGIVNELCLESPLLAERIKKQADEKARQG